MKNFYACLIIFLCFSCKENKKNEETISNNIEPVESSTTYSVEAPQIPETIEFCNKSYETSDFDFKERLDRELLVNNFWQSNTLLYIKRANRWFPLIEKILKEEGVPEDLKYLCVIESGLVQATSPSGAKGFWQFMKKTAGDYDLEVNKTVDERMNVEKSTKAACKYLKTAYAQFKDWPLAAASYNRGKAGIARDLSAQEVTSFFDLKLNNETSRYVFRILAVKTILENPTSFGFEVDESLLYSPFETKEIKVNENIENLAVWAKNKGFNYKILKTLNPWLISDHLKVKKNESYSILLPSSDKQLKRFSVQ